MLTGIIAMAVGLLAIGFSRYMKKKQRKKRSNESRARGEKEIKKRSCKREYRQLGVISWPTQNPRENDHRAAH